MLEDARADVHLADVVQRCPEPQLGQGALLPAEPAGNRLGVRADACGVALERGVADAHGGGKDGKPAHER